MSRFSSVIIIAVCIAASGFSSNVCDNGSCQCSNDRIRVNCDTKGWQNLDLFEFPPNVRVLTLINNNLKFDRISDRTKIENLSSLINLNLNQNPLGTIPSFNNTKIQFLSLQDTSLTSAAFPSSYENSFLQTISLNSNKFRSIRANDFIVFRNSTLTKLRLDDGSISNIDSTAFLPLIQLQSLSLKNNQLKSCDFLPNSPLLSSIDLDGNQFTSLPQELSIPRKIKTYLFRRNAISVIDESSPLYKWWKTNYTDIQIYLANNSFDCCSSLWFINFLKIAPHFVTDASLLTCTTPLAYAGQLLLKLDPDQMNCSGGNKGKSWWTIGRILGIIFGSFTIIIIGIAVAIVISRYLRRHRLRSGYEPIGQTDDDPYNTIDTLASGGPPFERADDDHDDAHSRYTYTGSIASLARSDAPTHVTDVGIPAIDTNQAGGIEVQETTSAVQNIF